MDQLLLLLLLLLQASCLSHNGLLLLHPESLSCMYWQAPAQCEKLTISGLDVTKVESVCDLMGDLTKHMWKGPCAHICDILSSSLQG